MLRYLPSNLSAPEIASELYLSTSTVKTHLLHIYAKLDAHRRTEAVERARELGCSPRSPLTAASTHLHTIRSMPAHPFGGEARAMDGSRGVR